MSLDMMGANSVGLLDDILRAGGEIAARYQAEEAAKEASSRDKLNLAEAIRADKDAALAIASAATSSELAVKAVGKAKAAADAKASADQSAMEIAMSAEDEAGTKVVASLAPQRIAAVKKEIGAATAKFQAAPEDVYARNLQRAWQNVLTKAQYGQFVKNAPEGDQPQSPKGESWFAQKTIIKSLPNYGTVAGGLGILGLGWLAVKKGLLHRFWIG